MSLHSHFSRRSSIYHNCIFVFHVAVIIFHVDSGRRSRLKSSFWHNRRQRHCLKLIFFFRFLEVFVVFVRASGQDAVDLVASHVAAEGIHALKNEIKFRRFSILKSRKRILKITYSSSEVALGTVVRLLRMRDHVTREMIFSDKSVVANVAFVRLVASVDSLMALQLCWSKK